MIEQHVEFHNVSEFKHLPTGGLQLLRFPSAVSQRLDDRGRWVANDAVGCEIRFVTPAKMIWVTLGVLPADADVVVFRGSFYHSRHTITTGVARTIVLEATGPFESMKAEVQTGYPFATDVWRVVFVRQGGVFFGIETFGSPIRPPNPEEKPRKRWLAYGSSITHSNGYDGYPHQAARRLRVDVLNCGLSGSCHCEKEMADHLASRGDWDIATMELGINMRGGFTPEQFGERADHLIRTMAKHNPDKPVAVITHFPTDATHHANSSKSREREIAFDDISRQIVKSINSPKVRLIEGADVLDRFDGLSCDLVHPDGFGQTVMGENLARLLRPWIGEGK